MNDDQENPARPNAVIVNQNSESLPLVAEAVFMTHIRCPNCRLHIEIEGNADRWILACPGCDKQLTVRLR
jgi:hypothetical protein